MRIRIFSSFTESKNCKEVYERLCQMTDTSLFTAADDYTHVIIQNTAMPSIGHIPKENVLGLAFEPPSFLGLTPTFVAWAKKHVGTYLIGDTTGLPAPFREHFGYMWHMPIPASIPPKTALISMAFSGKNARIPGYILRHTLVQRILTSSLPIDLYGHGCLLYAASGDKRLKGSFRDEEPYLPYKFSICIENFQTNHYFSEKIMNPLLSATTPIYFGARAIDSYFPNMVLHLPDTVDEIMQLLENICRDPSAFERTIDVNAVKSTISLANRIGDWFRA